MSSSAYLDIEAMPSSIDHIDYNTAQYKSSTMPLEVTIDQESMPSIYTISYLI